MTFREKVVLITGASSGIGAALAREAAGQGAHLVLIARRLDRLKPLAAECENRGVRALAIEGDVTREGSIESAVEKALAHFKKIDVVIANAGFGVAGSFEDLKLEDYRRQFETNVFGVLRTAYATLDALKRSRGHLVLLGSVAGHVALPGSSPYSMSKFAVRAMAEAVTEELRASGVSVTLISPGFVDSEIWRVDNQGQFHETAHDPIPSWIRVSSKSAAREIVRAIKRKKRERIVTGHGKIIVFLNRLFPWITQLIKQGGLRARREPH